MSSYEPKPGQYDERLLAEAPQATRAAKQEGYNVDLLNQPHAGGSSNSLQEPIASQPVAPNRNAYTPPTPADAVPQPYTTRKAPWYKTTRGIIILAVVALVIIGAVVGGAVGGTVGKNKSNNTVVPGTSSSSSSAAPSASGPDGAGIGQGQGNGATSTDPGLGESAPSSTAASGIASAVSGLAGAASTAAASQSASGSETLETGTPQRRRRMRL